MSVSATRLTLYAILSAIEEDLRRQIDFHLADHASPELLLGPDRLKKCVERLERDDGATNSPPSLRELINYIDFADAYEILNASRAQLPTSLAHYLGVVTTQLASLVPIRNRVAHSRPLNFDDLSITLDTVEALVHGDSDLWTAASETLKQLAAEPSFVLGLQIPAYESEVTDLHHNLPTPDYDETGFLGRKQQVEDLIGLCNGPYPVITIVGEGGLGKTALALKVAYDILDHPDNPFDAIVWTTSKTTLLTPHEIVKIEGAIQDSLGMLQDLATNLGGLSDNNPLDEIIAYLREFRILLILDNLETVLDDRVRGFLQRLPSGSKILITSRIGLGAFEYPMKLTPMEEGDAVALLRALAKSRRVAHLTQMANKPLAVYCRRMKNNPGYIKWFVSAVQTGKRPEEVLERPEIFLDFCMSNVYNYLSENSRRILNLMLCVPGRHSQSELAFLSDLVAVELQKVIQELLTTNMLIMSSVPRGSSFESQYNISDLARAYLMKHHASNSEEFRKHNRRRQQLVAAAEQIAAEQKINPYSMYSIAMRSQQDLIVAKYLLEALTEGKRDNFDRAETLIDNARNLAPDYFEVHRVEAWIKVMQRNIPAARLAYEAAIELEPKSAPLRLWFGGFLMRYADDVAGASTQIKEAAKLDPNASDIDLEMARVSLYLRNFDEARKHLDQLGQRSEMAVWKQRKYRDLLLQLYQRWSEHCLAQHDEGAAIRLLEQLKQSYTDCPAALADAQMKEKIIKALPTVRGCARSLSTDAQTRAQPLVDWWCAVTGASALLKGGSNRKFLGGIVRLRQDLGFGFIACDDGREMFFHRSSLPDPQMWSALQVGDIMAFDVGIRLGRSAAVDVTMAAR